MCWVKPQPGYRAASRVPVGLNDKLGYPLIREAGQKASPSPRPVGDQPHETVCFTPFAGDTEMCCLGGVVSLGSVWVSPRARLKGGPLPRRHLRSSTRGCRFVRTCARGL